MHNGEFFFTCNDAMSIPNKRISEIVLKELGSSSIVVRPNQCWWVEYNSLTGYPFCITVRKYLDKYFKKQYGTAFEALI